jgi:hypothetical protein
VAGGLDHRSYNGRMSVAENQRSPREHQIDIAVPVGIDQGGPLTPHHEPGSSTDPFECPDRAVDATGQHPLRRGEEPF